MTAEVRYSTAPDRDEERYQLREHWTRRVFVAVLVAFLLAALLGVFGVRTVEKTVVGGGFEMTVTYGRVSRPGLATVWSVEIVALEGSFDGPVTVAHDSRYFDIFDENGLDPDPAAATSEGDLLVWEFDEPEGDTLTVSFDARIEPGAQMLSQEGRTAVLVDGAEAVAVEYETFVMP